MYTVTSLWGRARDELRIASIQRRAITIVHAHIMPLLFKDACTLAD